jgi:hypothetical protein
MSQHDGGHAGVYLEYEEDRQAELVGDSDYEDDEYIQSVSSPACYVLGQMGFRPGMEPESNTRGTNCT